MQQGKGRRLYINEVAPRDGFQMESRFIPTDDKVALINQLGVLGYSKIEATSFTSPKAIPALADAEAVMHRIDRVPGVVYTALIPNVRGADRALECGVDEFNLVMSVSETHNLSNLRMTREQSFSQLQAVIELAQAAHVPVNVSLSCVFGCPMQGDILAADVHHWITRFAGLNVQGITLCDTTGMAYPTQVATLCADMLAAFPSTPFTAHFHNTRAMGLVNVVAAAQAGINHFDMSLGGIGGCPYAPGASGNVATEDVVHMLECMGYVTGMDLDGLLQATQVLQGLVQHDLSSQVARAGHRLVRHNPPPDFDQILARATERA
jgi:hydroxymethylglutaryl-CoA lyase